MILAALCLSFLQANVVPLDALFSAPQQTAAQISPDRQHISFLAPSDGHLTVWMEPIGSHDGQPLFKSETDIGNYRWAPDGKSVLFFQDHEGNEVYHLMSASVDTGEVKDLTPFDNVTAQNLITDANHPGEILVGLNKRSPGVFDMYRLNIATGEATLDTENPGDVLSWSVDSKFQIRACSAIDLKDASTYVRVRNDASSPWRELFHAPFEKSLQTAQYQGGSSVIGFCDGDQHLLVVDAVHSNAGQVEEWDVATGKFLKAVAPDSKADVDSDYGGADGTVHYCVLTDPKSGDVQAVRYDEGIPEWHATDRGVNLDLAHFGMFQPCNLTVESRAADDSMWIVHITSSVIPGRYYLYDRKKHKMDALFDEYPQLASYNFGPQLLVSYKARDGKQIPAYLTLPPGVKGKAPLILLPHGGPWFRDGIGFDSWAQFLATRGYAVLQPQYRGSVGFGSDFLNSATGEWSGKMSDDLIDGVQWAIKSGIADPKRIGVMGESYGGYAALTALWQNPDLFRCGVDVSGPADIGTLIDQFKDTWAPVRERWLRRIGGDPSSDQTLNEKISPLYHVDAIKAPVLVMHGKNDPRVKQSQAEAIVKALQSKGIKVEYELYPDEGHGISNPKNLIDFFTRAEKFLKANMGG